MLWKMFGPAHMRSINHLYNACHIKKVTIWPWTSEHDCCVKVGQISGQPPRFLPPPSIYLWGPYMPAGTCLNVSWRVAAALFHGAHLHRLGRCQGQIRRTRSDIYKVFQRRQHNTPLSCERRSLHGWDNPGVTGPVRAASPSLLNHGLTVTREAAAVILVARLGEILEPVCQKHRPANCS